jgi:pimeloyl-ACP methyl ester carboxylesterase
MGGAISISTIARHPELPIRSLFLISAVSEFTTIAPRLNLFTMHRHIAFRQALHKPRFDWKFRGSEKLRAVDDVRDVHVPLALLHVRNDWLIDHAHSEAIFEAANEPKELHLLDIPGSFHADRIFAVAAVQARSILTDFWMRINEKAALPRG